MDVTCTLGVRLDYRLRLWAHTSAACAVSAVTELLFSFRLVLEFTKVAFINRLKPKLKVKSHEKLITNSDVHRSIHTNYQITQCLISSF